MRCLICQKPDLNTWKVEAKPSRTYFQCQSCFYLFMDPAQRLTPEEEKARYNLHQNQETEGYRNFFRPLLEMILKHRRDDSLTALDFGCGPVPVFANLLADAQFDVSTYDPIFNNQTSCLSETYDLITCTEVWEHLYDPKSTFDILDRLLKQQGLLAVMTSAYPDKSTFQTWSYRRDVTHVGFFSEEAMRSIAIHFKWKLIESKSPYWIFVKE